jgi:hypothetical protein
MEFRSTLRRMTLTNTGLGPIEHIRAWCNGIGNEHFLDGTADGWGPLRWHTDGGTVAPGETKVIDVTDTVPAAAGDVGFVGAPCLFGPELLLGNPGDFATANIIGRKGKREGRLTTDLDGDGTFDDVVADTKVVLINRHTGKPVAKTRTNADGDFEFVDVPANVYELRVVGPWQAADDERLLFFAQSNEGLGRSFYRLVPGRTNRTRCPTRSPTRSRPRPRSHSPRGRWGPRRWRRIWPRPGPASPGWWGLGSGCWSPGPVR